jgi:hypothetical protein
MRRALLLMSAALAFAGAARADGLPVLGIDVGPDGVAAGSARYVTLPAGGGRTMVARISTRDGRVRAVRLLRGTFTVPAVAYDGTADGLSADGRRLVLIEPRASFPRATTTLAVLDTRRFRVERLVRLRGDFSFDAISPDGRWAYLIEYTSPSDPTRYDVRALSTLTGLLAARRIVDPHERGEKMRGNPLARVSSADGRWAYTLYDGAGGTPFVHALDTSGRTARCIDLDLLAGRQDLWRLRLSLAPRGTELRVGSVASVDLRNFRVSATRVAEARAAHGGLPWRTLAVAALGIGGLLAVLVGRRREGLRTRRAVRG